MSVAEAATETWQTVCSAAELIPNLGVRALIGAEQIAIFRVGGQYYAISAIDPFTGAAVLARGIVGDLKGHLVVASPIYKQHFDLQTGACLEDDSVSVQTWAVREREGLIEVAV